MAVFERPLKVGKIDNFTLTLSSGYLNGESIVSVSVNTESLNLQIGDIVFDESKISALCSGVSEGSAQIHFDWATSTRSGCETHTIIILAC